MISAPGPTDVELRRLAPATPPATDGGELVATIATSVPCRDQAVRRGSFVDIPGMSALEEITSCWFRAWIRPTMPHAPTQPLFSWEDDHSGFAVLVDRGRIVLGVGPVTDRHVVQSEAILEPGRWYLVVAGYEGASGDAAVVVEPRDQWPGQRPTTTTEALPSGLSVGSAAGARLAGSAGTDWPVQLYNGRIGDAGLTARRPDLRTAPDPDLPDVLASWDFTPTIGALQLPDRSPRGLHGDIVNRPTTSVTGPTWTGETHDFRQAPDQYAAIHFHDDDLDDAGWEPSVRFTLPDDLDSGVYAVRLRTATVTDTVPFFVRRAPAVAPKSIAFLAPTFSYLVYANEQLGNRPDIAEMLEQAGQPRSGPAYPFQEGDRYIIENRLLSCYDLHRDGTGVCYASDRRPLIGLRPDYLMPLLGSAGAPHQLGADLYLLEWLRRCGHDFDVVTDHDLHERGADALAGYGVVLTGSHPEYASGQMLDGLTRYLDDGGRLMYLGGNGFYWVTSLSDDGHTCEVRRSRGMRSWDAQPGEEHHSTTGELGGLWRFRGRIPQAWLGVGFSALGNLRGRPYERTTASQAECVKWVFEGVEQDLIGNHPNLVMETGAAGFEIDRADPSLGTPSGAIVLATAKDFDETYVNVVEEADAGGVVDPPHADMTYVEYPSGGAVWSVSSIMWCTALPWNDYDNPVSKVTRNVLERFLADSSTSNE